MTLELRIGERVRIVAAPDGVEDLDGRYATVDGHDPLGRGHFFYFRIDDGRYYWLAGSEVRRISLLERLALVAQ